MPWYGSHTRSPSCLPASFGFQVLPLRAAAPAPILSVDRSRRQRVSLPQHHGSSAPKLSTGRFFGAEDVRLLNQDVIIDDKTRQTFFCRRSRGADRQDDSRGPRTLPDCRSYTETTGRLRLESETGRLRQGRHAFLAPLPFVASSQRSATKRRRLRPSRTLLVSCCFAIA